MENYAQRVTKEAGIDSLLTDFTQVGTILDSWQDQIGRDRVLKTHKEKLTLCKIGDRRGSRFQFGTEGRSRYYRKKGKGQGNPRRIFAIKVKDTFQRKTAKIFTSVTGGKRNARGA